MAEKKEKRVVQYNDRCKGCDYCRLACPAEAISITEEINAKGYRTMKIDEELCTKCGACYLVCPDYVYEIIEVA
jgi:2-oxoglutarate ferredoxin oxidoreductase subunit delta